MSNLGMVWRENLWLIHVDLGAAGLLQAAPTPSPNILRAGHPQDVTSEPSCPV